MNNAISKALRTSRPIKLHEALREEISHWLFLRTWDDPLPWTDYWTKEEQELDISTKEAPALDKVLLSFSDSLRNAWVDGLVDNQAVVYSWQRKEGRSMSLNRAIKKLFFTTSKLNIALHLMYIPSKENEADAPSRRRTTLD